MTETWKPVAGYEGYYEVSDCGRVRSLDRVVECGRVKGIMRVSYKNPVSGYLTVMLSKHGTTKGFYVHSLVLEAFVGPRPDGMEACHYPDSNRDNCALSNLRWDTRKNNHKDKDAHGTSPKGERHPGAKLSEHDVYEIRKLRRAGLTFKSIGERFNVATMTAYRAAIGSLWSHIQEEHNA